MNLEYTGSEAIDEAPDKVWAFITDPAKLGSCLPDVTDITVHDATTFDATVKVALGLVRGKLKFKLRLEPDQATRKLAVIATGGGMGSAVDLTAHASVGADGTGTKMDWDGAATMRGPMAAVGGRVLDAQAKKLISQTFANVKAKVSAE